MLSKEVRDVACGAIALLASHLPGLAAPVQVTDACIEAAKKATVDAAFKVEARERPTQQTQKEQQASQADTQSPPVRLGDVIAVKVSSLENLKKECQNVPIILYLNGYPIRTVRPYPPSSPGELRFVLRVTDATRATDGTAIPASAGSAEKSNEIWRPVLGRPPLPLQDDRLVEVSVGLEGQPPLGPTAGKPPSFRLNVLSNWYFIGWGLLFLAMVAAFWGLVFKSNILRNGNPSVVTAGSKGTCSLSKVQGALWFFVIVAAYLFIGIVTGDYLNSINGTALILLGIGAGTVVGSAAIDAYKEDPGKRKVDTDAAAAKLQALDKEIKNIPSDLAANQGARQTLENAMQKPAGRDPAADAKELERLESEKAYLERRLLDGRAEREIVLSNLNKLAGRSEGWWIDILSDANGVSFHRFQLAAFTVVLAGVFILGVYDDLAMPEFNTTLMGLLGLSAGTYLGLKIPEATSPKKTT